MPACATTVGDEIPQTVSECSIRAIQEASSAFDSKPALRYAWRVVGFENDPYGIALKTAVCGTYTRPRSRLGAPLFDECYGYFSQALCPGKQNPLHDNCNHMRCHGDVPFDIPTYNNEIQGGTTSCPFRKAFPLFTGFISCTLLGKLLILILSLISLEWHRKAY